MSDLFHDDIPFDYIDKVFAVMKQCNQHTFIILTKRPERMLQYFKRADCFTRLDEAMLYMMGKYDGFESSVCYVRFSAAQCVAGCKR